MEVVFAFVAVIAVFAIWCGIGELIDKYCKDE